MSDNRLKALEDIRAKIKYLETVVGKLTTGGRLTTVPPPTHAVFDPSDVRGQKTALLAYAALKHKCEKQSLIWTSSRYEPNTVSCETCRWKASTRAESYFEFRRREERSEVASGNCPEFETMIVPLKWVKSVFPRGAFRRPHVYDEPSRYYHNSLQCLVCGGDENGRNHKNCSYSYLGGMVSGQMIVGPGVPLPKPLPENRPATEGEIRFFMSELNRLKELSARIIADMEYESSPAGRQMVRDRNRNFNRVIEEAASEASAREAYKRNLFQDYLNNSNDASSFEEWKERNS
jgi:hypothetical protein